MSWFEDDITFCMSECDDKRCFRHPYNMKDKSGLHSYAKFDNTLECKNYTVCKNCKFVRELRHNFTVGEGFTDSHCCAAFEHLNEKEPSSSTSFIVEVSLDSTCEMFTPVHGC